MPIILAYMSVILNSLCEGNLNTKYYPEFGYFWTTFIGILLEFPENITSMEFWQILKLAKFQ